MNPKRLVAIYLLGVCTPLVFALYLGGERLAVAGFRLAAVENGLRLAASDWHIDGVPAHQEPVAVAQMENVPAVKGKKVRR